MKVYTREELQTAVYAYVTSLSYDDLVQMVCEDLYEFYRSPIEDDELEEFMNEWLDK